jgi:hypothetical protein
MARPSAPRRRQRGVRVTVAGALLALAALLTVTALAIATVPVLASACIGTLLLGAAAARILLAEVRQSRRDQARERAAQARAYDAILADRSRAQRALTWTLVERVAAREREVSELEGTLRLLEARAAYAEDRARCDSRRLVDTQVRVAELETALAIRTAEEADELASWSTATDPGADTVVDLLAWRTASGGRSWTAGRPLGAPAQGL